MSNTNSAIKLTRDRSHTVLYGSPSDPDLQESKRKMERVGRQVVIKARAGFDTGLGQCGKHLCHCKGICLAQYSEIEKQFGV